MDAIVTISLNPQCAVIHSKWSELRRTLGSACAAEDTGNAVAGLPSSPVSCLVELSQAISVAQHITRALMATTSLECELVHLSPRAKRVR